jgi:hypothetical protein
MTESEADELAYQLAEATKLPTRTAHLHRGDHGWSALIDIDQNDNDPVAVGSDSQGYRVSVHRGVFSAPAANFEGVLELIGRFMAEIKRLRGESANR